MPQARPAGDGHVSFHVQEGLFWWHFYPTGGPLYQMHCAPD
jgi:hypothetical protein